MIAVVFVADDDEIGGLGDRLVSARVRRSIRVEDDPQALGLDEKRRVAVPGDAQGGVSGSSEITSIPFLGCVTISARVNGLVEGCRQRVQRA